MELTDKTWNKIAVIGASRGLGAAIVKCLVSLSSPPQILAVSRQKTKEPLPPECEWFQADLSQGAEQERLLESLEDFRPERVICTLGGGPYGEYGDKKWADHQWAMIVSLLFPARLWHWSLRTNVVQQVVVVGSSVAEDAADPRAASYAASKHGLKGLHRTLVAEKPSVDLRLFSPGYMDTDMIPRNARVRQGPIWSPEEVAQDLLVWLDQGPRFDHRRLAITPPSR